MIAQFLSIFGLGFLLGVKHALEPDHIVAVSTVASKTNKITQAAATGIYWGIGHTFTLFVIGMILIPIGKTIPSEIEMSLEILVALVIIGFGISTIIYFSKKKMGDGKESVRSKQNSFLIGVVHGLAGSGALIILAMSMVEHITEAAIFILLFGLGTILGMISFACVFSFLFHFFAKRRLGLERALGMGAGVFSILFGIFFIYEVGFIQ